MDAIGVKRPTETPHATAYVDEMVELIGDARRSRRRLRDRRRRLPLRSTGSTTTGSCARQSLDSLRAGGAVEADEEKRSPLDFALWKKAKPGEPIVAVAVGSGASGLAHRVRRDVARPAGRGVRPPRRGAGPRLPPPRERARPGRWRSGRPFARHWVHNGWVMVEGEKMSKSLGNFTSLLDLARVEPTPAPTACSCCAPHYRSPIEVTPATVDQAEKALARLDDWRDVSTCRTPWSVPPLRPPPSAEPTRSMASFSSTWTTTSTPPARWRASSTWLGGPTRPPTTATGRGPAPGRSPWPCCAARSGLHSWRVRRSSVDADDGRPGGRARPGPGRRGTTPGPTPSARELEARGWVVEDGPEGTGSHR